MKVDRSQIYFLFYLIILSLNLTSTIGCKRVGEQTAAAAAPKFHPPQAETYINESSNSKLIFSEPSQLRLGETSVNQANDKAILIYKRLVGAAPAPEDAVLTQIRDMVTANRLFDAAKLATAQDDFYRITLFRLAAKMMNTSETPNTGLNDFIATFIGCAREGLRSGTECNASTLLTGNYRYIRDFNAAGITDAAERDRFYFDHLINNSLYSRYQAQGFNLNQLVRQEPMLVANYINSGVNGQDTVSVDLTRTVPAAYASSLLLSRGFMSEMALNGTNRRPVAFAFREFLCVPIGTWADATNSDARVGADVSRAPAGDPNIYQTTCRACHSGMDSLRGAFAKIDFNANSSFPLVTLQATNRVNGTGENDKPPGLSFWENSAFPGVHFKMNRSAAAGVTFRVRDDSWENIATSPKNAEYFGWNGPMSGNGLNSFARMIANSDRFQKCMAQRVFQEVCKRDPAKDDVDMLNWAADEFKKDGYNLRNLFSRITIQRECMGN